MDGETGRIFAKQSHVQGRARDLDDASVTKKQEIGHWWMQWRRGHTGVIPELVEHGELEKPNFKAWMLTFYDFSQHDAAFSQQNCPGAKFLWLPSCPFSCSILIYIVLHIYIYIINNIFKVYAHLYNICQVSRCVKSCIHSIFHHVTWSVSWSIQYHQGHQVMAISSPSTARSCLSSRCPWAQTLELQLELGHWGRLVDCWMSSKQ